MNQYSNLANKRIGMINKNNRGSNMVIVKYEDKGNVWVQFEQGNIIRTDFQTFKRGLVKNPYDKTLYNRGFLGEGKYKGSINGKHTHEYRTWRNMFYRCYDKTYQEKHPTYKDCEVSEEWFNFQDFAKWHEENYYTIDNETISLDKDILIKGNKLYSPNTCIFAPKRINSLFVNQNNKRGSDPIGVSFNKKINRYCAQCHDLTSDVKKLSLGCYDTPMEAFNAYKSHKEKIIKQVAEEYKNRIPDKLYGAMMNYIITIND